MNDDDLFRVLIIAAVGAYCLLAATMEWKFFFNSRQVKFLEKRMSRKSTRIMYGVIGAGFMLLAALFALGIVPMHGEPLI